eukprot:10280655-Prorocentrum_lima.AAC.1
MDYFTDCEAVYNTYQGCPPNGTDAGDKAAAIWKQVWKNLGYGRQSGSWGPEVGGIQGEFPTAGSLLLPSSG